MEAFLNGFLTAIETYKIYIYILVAVALFACGIAYIIPSQKTRDWATSALPFVLIGCGIVVCAVSMASEFSTMWTF